MARSKGPKPKPLPRYLTQCGTPHHLEEGRHASAALAKNWLVARMQTRKEWGEKFSHAVRDQLVPVIEQLDSLNLPDAKAGRQWEWRVVDEVSGVQFVYVVSVLEGT